VKVFPAKNSRKAKQQITKTIYPHTTDKTRVKINKIGSKHLTKQNTNRTL
jgi:hypothetical protein